MAGPLNASEWQIRAPASACGACARAFADGETFRSRLVFAADEGYRREDLCERCWSATPAAGAVSFWRCVYRAPAPPPPEPVRKETAESLLRALLEKPDPSKAGVMFVLTVMLERRRVLVERDVRFHDDGTRTRIYEHRGTGETFAILDPGLRLDDLERVQAEVIALLGGGPAAPAASESAAPPTTGASNACST